MATSTTNFELFKYNTTTDASTAFSIDNALNANWDKLDSNCVRRLSTSAATGNTVTPVYVDSSGQIQTCTREIPEGGGLTATVSLSENGYIKFSNSFLMNWGHTKSFDVTVTFSIAYTTSYIGLATSIRNTSANAAEGCAAFYQKDLTQARVTAGGSPFSSYWLAIGY